MIPTLQLGQEGRSQWYGTLNEHRNGIWGAYSITKLFADYAGSAIRVRRSSDNAEQDIGFTGNALDTASLASFISTNSGYVVKMYDQSGLGHDITKATQSQQPRIVNAGTYDGKVVFDGSNDVLVSSANSGTPAAMTVIFKSKVRSIQNFARIFEHDSPNFSTAGHNACMYYTSTSSNNHRLDLSDGANYVENTYSAAPSDDVWGIRFNRAIASGANSPNASVLYIGGVPTTRAGSTGGGTQTVSTSSIYTAAAWSIGGRPAGDAQCPLDLYTFLIFEVDKSPDEVRDISLRIA
jgi:hypothetical protein